MAKSDIDRLLDLEISRIKEVLGLSTPNEGLFSNPKTNVQNTLTVSEVAERVHQNLIIDLVYNYLSYRGVKNPDRKVRDYFICCDDQIFTTIEVVSPLEIPYLCELLHVAYLNSDFKVSNRRLTRSKSKVNLIEKGAVYTKSEIVDEIVDNTLAFYQVSRAMSLLDFACGTGRFYESAVKILEQDYNIDREYSVLHNLYAVDIDPNAVNVTRLKAISFITSLSDKNLSRISQTILLRNALVRNGLFDFAENPMQREDFDGKAESGFDVIVSNPPYLGLKISKKKGEGMAARVQQQVSYFRNSGDYLYSIEGVLNYYQISIERMLTMLATGGEMGIICPSSLFADLSATKLRSYMLNNHKVRGLRYFSEKEPLFDNVTQATTIFYLQKGGKTDVIKVQEGVDKFDVDIKLVRRLFAKNLEIPFIGELEWVILDKLSKFKRLKDFSNVRNRRGELDLTIYSEFFKLLYLKVVNI